jgi:glycosyltransferase involved in cell wall biosynthesis
MPQRVLFLSNTLGTGGSERNVVFFCNQIDRQQFLPEVWVFQGNGAFEQEVIASGIKLKNLERKHAYSPWFALRAAHAIAHAPVDLVHAFHPAIAFYAGLAKSLWGLPGPLIFSLGTTVHPGIISSSLYKHFLVRQIDHIFVNSASVGEFARELGHLPERIHLLENGHDLKKFERPFDRAAMRRQFGWGDETLGIICVGRLIDTKRYCDLVATVKILSDRGLPVKAIIVGEGPMRSKIEQQISENSLQSKITLTGRRDDVADLLRIADLFAYPSVVEGLPNSVIEAQLAGLPIVAADIPGTRDVVHQGITGELVEPMNPKQMAERLLELWQDSPRRESLGATAKAQARARFGAAATIQRFEGLYQQILG